MFSLFSLPLALQADESAILRELSGAFARPTEIAAISARIAADPAYDRAKLSDWLHQAAPYPVLAAGRSEIVVDVGLGFGRRVAMRLPRNYSPTRRWPLIYALHPSGGNGPDFIGNVEHLLGSTIEDFVVVAPSNYRQTGIDAPPPFTRDHPGILRAVREQVHVDGDRVYALGYSLGGYASWAVALLHADELAAAVPIASTVTVPPDVEHGLWREVVGNLSNLGELLFVWGGNDSLEVWGYDGSLLGGIATLNRRYRTWSKDLGLPQTLIEQRGRGHGDVQPPKAEVLRALAHRRAHWPRQVDHTYRHLHQGSAYWLEAVDWTGERWAEATPTPDRRSGESAGESYRRVLAPLLGHLAGSIEGQTLRITTRHVGTLDVWLGDGMFDWQQPLRVERDGQLIHDGVVNPDLALAIGESVARYELDRLRWGRVKSHRVEAADKR